MTTPQPDDTLGRIDPALESDLDQALSPQPAAPQLASRIVARTTPMLSQPQPVKPARVSVLARLAQPARIAAAIALLATLCFGLYAFSPPEEPYSAYADSAALETFAVSEGPVPGVDHRVDRLTALVIINQTSDLVGRPPATDEELAQWYRLDPLTY